MTPQAIMALMQAVPAAAQGITALLQNRKANQLGKNLKDPNYEVPEEYQQLLGSARSDASMKHMAGYDSLQENLNQQTANTTSDVLQSASSSTDALAGLTAMDRNNRSQQTEIGVADAQDKMRRQQELRSALQLMGGQREKQFDINTMQKFLRDSAAVSSLKNAALNNGYQAIKGLSGAGAGYFGNKAGVPPTQQTPQLTPEQLQMIQMMGYGNSAINKPVNTIYN